MNTFPPPVPDRRRITAIRVVQIVAATLVALFIIGTVFGEEAAPTTTTTSTSTTTTVVETQADRERYFTQWVEDEYNGRYVPDISLKVVKMACEGLADGATNDDLAQIIMNTGVPESQMMDMAGIMGEGIRYLCPEWAWKLSK